MMIWLPQVAVAIDGDTIQNETISGSGVVFMFLSVQMEMCYLNFGCEVDAFIM